MGSDESNLFTWNDVVIIKPDAPLSYFPGKIAVICGMEQGPCSQIRPARLPISSIETPCF